jgi:hypothetical protein
MQGRDEPLANPAGCSDCSWPWHWFPSMARSVVLTEPRLQVKTYASTLFRTHSSHEKRISRACHGLNRIQFFFCTKFSYSSEQNSVFLLRKVKFCLKTKSVLVVVNKIHLILWTKLCFPSEQSSVFLLNKIQFFFWTKCSFSPKQSSFDPLNKIQFFLLDTVQFLFWREFSLFWNKFSFCSWAKFSYSSEQNLVLLLNKF